MNKLIFIKFIVFLLTGLLFAGFGLLFHKIAKKNSKINPPTQQASTTPHQDTFLFLEEGETVQSVFSCQNFLCLTILKEEKPFRIQVINPQTGKTLYSIFISLKKEAINEN